MKRSNRPERKQARRETATNPPGDQRWDNKRKVWIKR